MFFAAADATALVAGRLVGLLQSILLLLFILSVIPSSSSSSSSMSNYLSHRQNTTKSDNLKRLQIGSIFTHFFAVVMTSYKFLSMRSIITIAHADWHRCLSFKLAAGKVKKIPMRGGGGGDGRKGESGGHAICGYQYSMD